MTEILEAITNSNSLALIITGGGFIYFYKKSSHDKKKLEEKVEKISVRLEKYIVEVTYLKTKTEVEEHIGAKLDRIEDLILATKNPSN